MAEKVELYCCESDRLWPQVMQTGRYQAPVWGERAGGVRPGADGKDDLGGWADKNDIPRVDGLGGMKQYEQENGKTVLLGGKIALMCFDVSVTVRKTTPAVGNAPVDTGTAVLKRVLLCDAGQEGDRDALLASAWNGACGESSAEQVAKELLEEVSAAGLGRVLVHGKLLLRDSGQWWWLGTGRPLEDGDGVKWDQESGWGFLHNLGGAASCWTWRRRSTTRWREEEEACGRATSTWRAGKQPVLRYRADAGLGRMR